MTPIYSLLTKAATAGLTGTVIVYAVGLAGALVHYSAAALRERSRLSIAGFVAHVAPAQLVWSRWTRADIIIFALNKFALALVMPNAATLVALIATGLQGSLVALALRPVAMPQNPVWVIVFLGCGLLLRDFAAFYTHLMQHRIALLWEFHKVHHAPESLIPPTGHRIHPIEQIMNMVSESLLLGLLVGVFAWLTDLGQTDLIIYSVGMYVIANTVTLSPLRHSHIDLRLGPMEWLFFSPAHHQLHHSAEPQHRDKNFGTIFPIWDRLWRTHAIPPAKPYRMGLSGGESANYASVWNAYWTPLVRLTQRPLWRSLQLRPILSAPSTARPTAQQTRVATPARPASIVDSTDAPAAPV